jgi:hypothetical protein
MKSAMGDALKSLKGPPAAPPVLDEGAGEGFAAGGESIDLSKIDPGLIEAIIKQLTESGMVEVKESPLHEAQEGAPVGGLVDPKKEMETDQAPNREAISAIADGGVSHEAGSLGARAAAKAKGHLASMKGK